MTIRQIVSDSWRDVAVAFNCASALFAVPLYVPLYASPGAAELAALVLMVQIAPAFVILAIGYVFRVLTSSGFIWRAYWITVALAALASLLRLWQRQSGLGFPDAPPMAKFAAVVSVVPLVIVLTALRADWIPRTIGRTAPVTAVVCAAFLVFVQLSPSVGGSAKNEAPTREDAVFILIFDELGRDALERDGRVDSTVFPNLGGLAADGAWVADATSNYSPSCQSIPSILTGRPQPRCDESFLTGTKAVLLQTLATAYALEIYGEYLRGCPNGVYLCKGIPYFTAHYPLAGITNHLFPQAIRPGPILDFFGGRDANPYTLALWSDFLERVRTNDLRGRAFFVHINLPHSPYAYRQNGTLSRAPSRSQYFYGTEQDAVAYENYREQVRFVDALLGSLIEVLRQRSAYETSSIFITGDHGPRLQLPPRTLTLQGIAAQTPSVPVIIKTPRVEPPYQTAEYQHIDFTPTVLDALGLPTTTRFEGRSVLSASAQSRQKWFMTGDRLFIRERDGIWYRLEDVVPWPEGLTPR